jgi:hypothetical protein
MGRQDEEESGAHQEDDVHQTTEVECSEYGLNEIAGGSKDEISDTIFEEKATESTLLSNCEQISKKMQ